MQKMSLMLVFLLLLVVGGLVLFLSNQTSSVSAIEERCRPLNAPYKNPSIPTEARVNDLLSRMTQREKIGQLALVEKNGLTSPDDIRDYTLGALLSGAGSRPATNTPEAWLDMVIGYQRKAKETCLGIPILYGIDAIHGLSGVEGATIFPHAIGLATTRDLDLVRRVAEATTQEMSATGIYWNFAPNLDVTQDQRWGRVYETFGSDTQAVSELGLAYLQGTQTTQGNYLTALATPKHFIGNGAMTWGTSGNSTYTIDQGDARINEQELRAKHLPPFKNAIDSGALAIMAGLNQWNGKKISADHYLLTDVLKNELGFNGMVVSDWYGVYALDPDRYTATVTGINAGIDMVMLPFEYRLFITDMERALQNGDISEKRLDDAVRRILTVKFTVGLFDRPEATKAGLSVIGSSAHRDLAREAVQKSQILLKNSDQTLPLAFHTKRIFVAGSAAHNLGQQSGGWTIEWQGIDGNTIPGTTILEGIQKTVSSGTHIEYSVSADFSTQELADIGIAVVGEKPYAEGVGDQPNPHISEEDLATIRNVQKASKKLVVIIVSGRALALPAEAASWDSIVVAWLPGSEGQGVADALFSD